MKLMDDGIKNTKVKEGLKQLQKKLVNAGRKSPPSTAKRTDIGGSLYMVFWYLVRHACFAFLCYNTSPVTLSAAHLQVTTNTVLS